MIEEPFGTSAVQKLLKPIPVNARCMQSCSPVARMLSGIAIAVVHADTVSRPIGLMQASAENVSGAARSGQNLRRAGTSSMKGDEGTGGVWWQSS